MNGIKIISGGQTGVDRIALDVAIEVGIEHGGWCPAGRRAEDGPIDSKYRLIETASKNYAVRTRKNIEDSDGTLVLTKMPLTGGTKLTNEIAKSIGRSVLVIDLEIDRFEEVQSAWMIMDWIKGQQIRVLNVAGPRLSSNPDLPLKIEPLLRRVFSMLGQC